MVSLEMGVVSIRLLIPDPSESHHIFVNVFFPFPATQTCSIIWPYPLIASIPGSFTSTPTRTLQSCMSPLDTISVLLSASSNLSCPLPRLLHYRFCPLLWLLLICPLPLVLSHCPLPRVLSPMSMPRTPISFAHFPDSYLFPPAHCPVS